MEQHLTVGTVFKCYLWSSIQNFCFLPWFKTKPVNTPLVLIAPRVPQRAPAEERTHQEWTPSSAQHTSLLWLGSATQPGQDSALPVLPRAFHDAQAPAQTGASHGLHVTLCHASQPFQKPEHQRKECLNRPAGYRNNSDPQDFSIWTVFLMRKWLNSSQHNLVLEAAQSVLRSAVPDLINSARATFRVCLQPTEAIHKQENSMYLI